MIEHHHYTVYSMEFSSCGKFLASVSKDRRLTVFNEDFNVVFSAEAHARAIMCVCFSPNCEFVATGSRDKFIKIHSIISKSQVCEYEVKK